MFITQVRRIPIVLIAVSLILPLMVSVSAQTQLLQDTTAAAISLDDGPYILWRSPRSATVFYLGDGAVERQDFENIDTLRFTGFCADSSRQYIIPAEGPGIQPYIFENVPRIFAISDIHGEYAPMVDLLKNAGIVNEHLHWNWGDGHLVINGDVFDRGPQVTECLWLIYRLEKEAPRAGGRVHFILGNHELMVLCGDNRYVHEKYLKGIVRKSRVRHVDLYGPDMELGRWLRTRHTMLRLNDILFVHGGASPELLERGINMEQVNQQVRDNLDVRSYMLAFGVYDKFLYGSKGPLWYRGYITDELYPQATDAQLDSVLNFYGAAAVVVGHTGVDRVESLYDGRVFAIDIPLEKLQSFQGLLWVDGVFYRVLGSGGMEEL